MYLLMEGVRGAVFAVFYLMVEMGGPYLPYFELMRIFLVLGEVEFLSRKELGDDFLEW